MSSITYAGINEGPGVVLNGPVFHGIHIRANGGDATVKIGPPGSEAIFQVYDEPGYLFLEVGGSRIEVISGSIDFIALG